MRLRDLFRFWWRRDDQSASILCILMANYMRPKSRRDIADYMHAMNEADERRAANGGRDGT